MTKETKIILMQDMILSDLHRIGLPSRDTITKIRSIFDEDELLKLMEQGVKIVSLKEFECVLQQKHR